MGQDWAPAQNRELGHELRRRRMAAGLTGAELARQMGTTPLRISRMEVGKRTASVVDVISYLAFLEIYSSAAEDVVEMSRRPDRNIGYWLSPHGEWLPDSLGSLIYHESTAAATIWYDPLVVNGLLQTADYARTMISREAWRTPENVEACVEIRMNRQRLLNRHNPPEYTFFLHEEALRRQVVGSAEMHDQLLKIVLLSALDHVTVRIVPAQLTFGGPFYLFRYETHVPLVYLDHPSTGLFLEDKEYVDTYQYLVADLADVALDGAQSREFIAALASEYDRGSLRDVGVEEEQL